MTLPQQGADRAVLRSAGWDAVAPQDSLAAVGETELLDRLIARAGRGPSTGTEEVGPGDDAGAWRFASPVALLSTDTLMEGIDFSRSWQTPYQLGRKAWGVAASDMAAMGAVPEVGLVAAILPPSLGALAVESIQLGIVEAAHDDQAWIIGGDLSRGDQSVALTVTVGGSVPDGAPVRLSGGQVGDWLVVTGSLGGAAGALRCHLDSQAPFLDPSWDERLLTPKARVQAGMELRRLGARAMTDLSDGLLLDLGRLALASGVGASLWLDQIPEAPGLRQAFGSKARDLSLLGGEDFELLAALPAELVDWSEAGSLLSSISLTCVGVLEAEPGVRLWSGRGGSRLEVPERGGFRHF